MLLVVHLLHNRTYSITEVVSWSCVVYTICVWIILPKTIVYLIHPLGYIAVAALKRVNRPAVVVKEFGHAE